MNRIKKIFKKVFISPELITTCLLFFIFLIFKQPFIWIGEKIFANNLLVYTSAVPTGLLIFSIKRVKEILLPNHRSKNILLEWDEYQELKDTTYIGIFYLIIGLAISSYFSVVETGMAKSTISLWLLIAYSISIISCSTMFFAQINIEEILEKYT